MFYSQTKKNGGVLDLASLPDVKPSLDDEEYEVTSKYHHRPDIMSNDIYGSPKYWFVFMLRNMDLMDDPVYGLEAGMTILVPHPRTVKKLK